MQNAQHSVKKQGGGWGKEGGQLLTRDHQVPKQKAINYYRANHFAIPIEQ